MNNIPNKFVLSQIHQLFVLDTIQSLSQTVLKSGLVCNKRVAYQQLYQNYKFLQTSPNINLAIVLSLTFRTRH